MGLFFIYSIKVALCLTAFYMLYKLLLSRDTLFGFNRAVLLCMAAVSLVLPAVHFADGGHNAVASGFVVVEDAIVTAVTSEPRHSGLTPAQACFAIYVLGVAFFLCREAWSLVGLRRLIRSGRIADYDDGVRTVVVPGEAAPFSWFGYIVINEKDYADHPEYILAHERAHIARRHSVDILLCDLLIAFQWYNPAAWLIKAELQSVHEYEADRAVLSSGVDAAGYQLLLIRKAVGDRLFSLANNLNQCSLKKRITMMQKRRSNPLNGLKAFLAVPVAAVAVAAFATPKAESMSDEIKAESDALVAAVVSTQSRDSQPDKFAAVAADGKTAGKAEQTGALAPVTEDGLAPVAQDDPDEKVYDITEMMPEFPGGNEAMMDYLKKNIKYPESAKKSGKKGRVIVQFTIGSDGGVRDVKVRRGVDPDIDKEAVRVVSSMPKWTPGKQDGKPVAVKYTLPILFDNGNKAGGDAVTIVGSESRKGTKGNPIYVVGGKKVADISGINEQDIDHIVVLKGEQAVKKYGDDAKDGVMEITMKKK